MKILREGVDLSEHNKDECVAKRIVHCPKCGCIFQTYYHEREYVGGGVDEYYYCPNETCKRRINHINNKI